MSGKAIPSRRRMNMAADRRLLWPLRARMAKSNREIRCGAVETNPPHSPDHCTRLSLFCRSKHPTREETAYTGGSNNYVLSE